MSEPTRVIAISGKSGCGNTTVSRLLAEVLHRRLINYTFHNLADELGLPFTTLLETAKNDFSFDRMLDTRQVAMTKAVDCVIGSRLAIWLLPQAELRVFLTADPEVRARRVHQREGGDLAAIMAFTHRRDEMDTERYRAIYGLDNNEYGFADLVINATRLDPPCIVRAIIGALPLANSTLAGC
ncbi:MAG: cytidylate kinase [Spirochaetes bacterium GWD1_61_31]|nr:MAG: cytidylate kinase [Spirochaetes bacterium GWB1_60_80]OHD29647.1 MAG: cytidylate kinase [Spirochaetes bacterium GWC1_61_12]OHD34706.1 MAG: cytidylate kinase [Spirochaetes bacterium GWD1_61_31]OHD41938.1 MAG: cytidylate kinase [Spirochaetes bacterium GWE1_60_18]OHD61796.1 MAG: cytidylate kinase [Spirochaetes bacterium GWF1_60_12]HAW85155.1 cytidylate kinase [Spirochaetaceae bacterium]